MSKPPEFDAPCKCVLFGTRVPGIQFVLVPVLNEFDPHYYRPDGTATILGDLTSLFEDTEYDWIPDSDKI